MTHTPERRPARIPDFSLTMDELRTVTAFAVASAEQVLPVFEAYHPDNPEPGNALAAATAFAHGDKRSRAQRMTAPAAHRAARKASSRLAFHAAMAAGDAAASAYLHPLAEATQVGHILRASAHSIRVFELCSDEEVGDPIQQTVDRATPVLIDVLCRYPSTRARGNRVSRLVHALDNRLRVLQHTRTENGDRGSEHR